MPTPTLRNLPHIPSRHDRRLPLPIEDYAVIGDLQTCALVGMDGSIDWLCLPSFSSGACFAALLGHPGNGRWLLRPKDAVRDVTRRYDGPGLVLETRFETKTGVVLVTDFMPVRDGLPHLGRHVRCVEGRVQMFSELVLRFDYGQAIPWVTEDDGGLRAICGPDMVMFRTPVECHGESLSTVSDFTMKKGESTHFSITYQKSHLKVPEAIDCERALAETRKFWDEWAARSSYKGRYAEAVSRSLVTLKALTYQPTGGIVAAPTTSLPEKLGGVRNWDYRYCWLRDTTFTLLALMDAGYVDEGRAWRDWLTRALAGSAEQVQIMYGICGERSLPERTLDHLEGYQGAKPVHIGNGAVQQVQLDIFGEILDAMYHGMVGRLKRDEGIPEERLVENLALIANLLERLDKIWMEPDRGMWEMRSKPKHYVHSKVMAWVAYERAVRIAALVGQARLTQHLPVKKWEATRDKIHRDVLKHGFNRRMNSFTQAFGNTKVDAALLLVVLVGFLPVDDPRMVGTVDAVLKHLVKDGLVLRYLPDPGADGLPPGEGAFLACSFWMVCCLKMTGREEQAVELFERLLDLRNDVGLLPEEYDTQAKRMTGNFPQALSHISLISAAFLLDPGPGVEGGAPLGTLMVT